MLSSLGQDLRYAIRVLAGSPLHLATVALTLGAAIGGTTAVFTFVNAVLLRPLAYADAGRLVKPCETHPEYGDDFCHAAPGDVADWKRLSGSLEAVGLARSWPFTLKREAGSTALRGGFATPDVFKALGVRPLRGRLFDDRDVAPGASTVALVSRAFWRNQLGSDPQFPGGRLKTDYGEAEVVGLLSEDFAVPELERVEVWFSFPREWMQRRDWRGFTPFGKLREDVTVEGARAELGTIAEDLARLHPDTNQGYGMSVVPLQEWLARAVRRPLWIFMTAVLLVLLIATANVANLVLVRISRRSREFAVRTALGARRRRLLRQLFIENGLLALAGAVVGAPLAYALVGVVRTLAPRDFGRLRDVSLDGSALLFSLALALLVCSCLAVITTPRGDSDLSLALREGRAGGTRAGFRMRSLLAGAEIGLAVLLLVGAALLSRSLFNLLEWRPGFEVDHVMTAFMTAPTDEYANGDQAARILQQAVDEAAGAPGVVSAGAASGGPLFGGGDGRIRFLVEGRPAPKSKEEYPSAVRYDSTPTFFSSLGIPLKEGRFFSDADRSGFPRVAIVNETLARRHWPATSAVGQRVRLLRRDDQFESLEIVGVVADVPPFRPDRSTEPEIYWPLAQEPRWGTTLVVRTATEPQSVSKEIENRVARLDPDLQLGTFRTLRELSELELVEPRFFLFLMGVFAVIGLVLATIGIYGVLAGMAAERTHEIATRMALGASWLDILRLMLGKGALLALCGLAAGLAGALLLAPLLSNLLVAVDALDGPSFAAAALLLGAACLLGSYLPARRASRVDPAVALRLAPFV